MKLLLRNPILLGLLALLFAHGARGATTGLPFVEDFATDPVAQGRFFQLTAGTESTFTFNPGTGNLTAVLDVDASPAFYLSNPLPRMTETNDVSFSVEFRVTGFDLGAAPAAFLGLFTTNHVDAFGDGLSLVLSVADGLLVANANLDANDQRSAGATIELDLNTTYRAIGRFHPARRAFSVAIFGGTDFTNLLQVSTAVLPPDRKLVLDRLGIQNGGARLTDFSIGSLTLVADEFHLPARGRPLVSVGAARVLEGDSGRTSVAVPVSLSFPTDLPVSIVCATVAGTATTGVDFVPSSTTISFAPGEIEKTVTVEVHGDVANEADEEFALVLAQPVNAIAGPPGSVSIANDDGLAGKLDHFAWAAIPSPQPLGSPFGVSLTAVDLEGRTVSSFNGAVELVASPLPRWQTVGPTTGSVNWNFPLASSAHDARTQVLLLASELGGPGTLTALDLNVVSPPGRVLGSWTIRIKPTALAAYTATPSWESTGWTIVHRGVVPAGRTGWVTFPFTTPFEYSGTGNLLVDLSFNTAAAGSDVSTLAVETGRNRSLTFTSNSGNGDPLAWTARNPAPVVSTRIPRLRFTALRPVQISPIRTPSFVGGAWQGDLTVLEPVTNLVVTAVDDLGRTGSGNPFTVGILGDLAIALSATPASPRIGQSLTYTLVATNRGLLPATGVVVSDRLPTQVAYVSASGPRGSCTFDGADVSCDAGLLASGGSATFTIVATVLNQGSITNRARVSARESDPDPANNLATLIVVAAPPQLTLEGPQVTEGDNFPIEAVFPVRVSAADREVTVDYETTPGTALEGVDYRRTTGRLTFPPGTGLREIRVPVLPDILAEDDESFSVRLFNPQGATVLTPVGTAAILDNDVASRPCVSSANFSIVEGDAGTTNAVFTVTLSRVSGQTVRVDYATSSRTATQGTDYQFTSGTLSFTPGTLSQTVSVLVLGDRDIEPDETFALGLYNPANATLCDGIADSPPRVRIVNDDGLDGRLDHFAWATIPSPQGTNAPFDVQINAVDAAGRTVPSFTGPVTILPSLVPEERLTTTSGTSVNWNFPLTGTAHDARTQVILHASELGGPGRLTGLALNILTSPGRTLGNWIIRLKPTSLSSYSASPSWDGAGWTVVFGGNVSGSATGWVWFTFGTPFDYDGTSNLLVDFSFNTGATGRDGVCLATDSGRSRSLTFTSNSSNGDPLRWEARNPAPVTSTRVPKLRFSVQRPIRISPTTTTAFVGGMWTGSLVVLEPATNLVLTAADRETRTGSSNPFDVGLLADVAAGISVNPAEPRVAQRFDYLLSVTNVGLLTATGVVLTDRLPPEVRFESVVGPSGGCSYDGRDVICLVGDVPPGGTVSAVVVVTALTQGAITNRVRATTSLADARPENNLATLVTWVAPPLLTIEDVSVAEGNSGTVDAVFSLRVSVVDREVRVEFATLDDTAIGGLDFLRTNGVVIFPPGTRTAQIRVPILGDLLTEDAEKFTLRLSNPINAVLFRANAVGIITDDDFEFRPCLSVTPATLAEGDSGTSQAVFALQLSRASGQTVRVAYATVAGTAAGGSDFLPATGILELAPGARGGTVLVPILGDRTAEPDESFSVRFTALANAAFCDDKLELLAAGILVNDDGLVGKLDHFKWATIASPQATNAPFAVTVTAVDTEGRTVSSFQEAVDLLPPLLAMTNLVGTSRPTENWRFPLAGTSHDARTQVIVLATELGGPGKLTALAIHVAAAPGRVLGSWVIRLKATPVSVYPTTPSWESVGWTVVGRGVIPAATTGWINFEFFTPFEYDGTSNLFVDLSFNTSTTGPDGQCTAVDTGRSRSLTFTSNSANGDPLTWAARNPAPAPSTRIPQLRFTRQRPVVMAPTRTAPFVDGVWTGQLAVADLATGVVVEANDGKEHTGRSNPFDVGVLGDLAIALTASPTNARLGQPLTWRLAVTNLGLATATGVTVSDRLPAEVRFESATGSRGACTYDGRDVTCLPGDLSPGGSAIFDVVGTTLAQGSITNRAKVTASEADPFPDNNLATLASPIAPPLLAIDGVQVVEGTGTSVAAVFTVRATASDREIRVAFATVDDTARARLDYTPTNGVLVLPAGVRTNFIRVPILGDALREDAESFSVALSNPVNAGLAQGSATALILDDDAAEIPCLAIAPVAIAETDGRPTNAVFVLTLSKPSGQTITLDYATADRTATAGADYLPISGRLTLPPGTLATNLSVTILPDRIVEPDEVFELRLATLVNATFCAGTSSTTPGTILNDDGLPGRLDHFSWEPIPSPQGIDQPFDVALAARDVFGQMVPSFNRSVAIRGLSQPTDFTAPTAATQTTWAYPLAATAHDARLQAIYLPQDLGSAGRLTSLALSVVTAPGRVLRNWTLRLKPTSLTVYPASPSWDSTGWTVVHRSDLNLAAPGWFTFPFVQPFEYDGTSGLLVDFTFETTGTGRDATVHAVDTGRSRSLIATANSTAGDPLAWSATSPAPTVNPRVPLVRFTIQRRVPVLPTTAGPFVAGTANARALVSTNIANLVLEADDGETHGGQSNPFDVGILGDLAISQTASAASVRIGQSLTYQLTVTNRGLTRASGVIVTDRLPPEVGFVSATGPRGGCQVLGREIVCDLGQLEPQAAALFDVQVAALVQGFITNRARVSASESDPDPANNVNLLVTPVSPPVLAIQSTSVREGDGDPLDAVFAVRLSNSGKEVRVNYATADGSARASQDYFAASGTLVFPVGIATNYIRVPILGDTTPEGAESFTVTLSAPANADLFTATATGGIDDDDHAGVAVQPARRVEGQAGTSPLVFNITVFPPPAAPVTVTYATQDDGARAGSDYLPVTGSVVFPAGATLQTVQVPILGDTIHEADEAFRLVLTSVSGATIDKPAAPGTIVNDDLPECSGPDVLVNLAIPGSSNAVLRLTLSYPSLQEIEIDYATADGTATAGTDYTAQSGTLRLPPGTTVAAVSIPVIPNTLDETNEFFRVLLDRPRQVSLPDSELIVTIVNTATANQPPAIARLPDQTVLEDSGPRTTALIVFDPETPAARLALTAVASNASLLARLSSSVADSTLSFTPAPDAFGETTLRVTVADESGASSAAEFRLQVLPVNDPPSLDPLADVVLADGAAELTLPLTGLSAGPPNERSQTLSLAVESDPPGLVAAPVVEYVSPNPAGRLRFTPVPNAGGTARITVRLKDDGGTANGGIDATARSFNLTVTRAALPPTVRLIQPLDYATFAPDPDRIPPTTDLTLAAEVTPGSAPIVRVEFFSGSVRLGTATSRPYVLPWNNVGVGDYRLTARAFDSDGRSAESAPVRISVSDLAAEVAIIRNYADPEVDQVRGHLLEMGLSSRVFDQEGLSFELLRHYRLIIWLGLSRTGEGISDNDVEILRQAFSANLPLYFIGDHLLTDVTRLAAPMKSAWSTLLHLRPGGRPPAGGPIDVAPFTDDPDLIFTQPGIVNGRYGTATDLVDAGPFDTGQLLADEDGQSIGRIAGGDVFLAFPHHDLAEPGRVRSFTQLGRIARAPDEESALAKRILFQNVVCWLVECRRCGAVDLKVHLESPAGPAKLGEPVRYRVIVGQSGECEATGVTLRGLLPVGATAVRVGSERGSVELTPREIILRLGHLASAEETTVDIEFVPALPGPTEFCVALAGNNAASGADDTTCSTITVEGDLIPRLAAERTGNDIRLAWPAAAAGWVLESSPALGASARWTPVPGSPTSSAGQLSLIVPRTPDSRYFRLRR